MLQTPVKPKVLFICHDQHVLSPIAQALLHHYAGDTIEALSAGLYPQQIHPLVEPALRHQGFLSPLPEPRSLGEYWGGKLRVAHTVLLDAPSAQALPITPYSRDRAVWTVEGYPAPDLDQADLERIIQSLEAHILASLPSFQSIPPLRPLALALGIKDFLNS